MFAAKTMLTPMQGIGAASILACDVGSSGVTVVSRSRGWQAGMLAAPVTALICNRTSTSCVLTNVKNCKISTIDVKTLGIGDRIFDIDVICITRIRDLMSLIKVIIYAMIFVLSLLLMGRFFF